MKKIFWLNILSLILFALLVNGHLLSLVSFMALCAVSQAWGLYIINHHDFTFARGLRTIGMTAAGLAFAAILTVLITIIAIPFGESKSLLGSSNFWMGFAGFIWGAFIVSWYRKPRSLTWNLYPVE